MICLMSSQVRFRVVGSLARAFQKLLIQSVLRVAMISSYTSRTSDEASWYSMKPRVGIDLHTMGWTTEEAESGEKDGANLRLCVFRGWLLFRCSRTHLSRVEPTHVRQGPLHSAPDRDQLRGDGDGNFFRCDGSNIKSHGRVNPFKERLR